MSTKLYVGNLPYQTTESDLQTLFEAIGPVDTINVVTDRATGRARGFAFVEMSDADGASRAINELDRRDYGGRSLTVNEAKPMARRDNDDGGRGNRQIGRAGAHIEDALTAGELLSYKEGSTGTVAVQETIGPPGTIFDAGIADADKQLILRANAMKLLSLE